MNVNEELSSLVCVLVSYFLDGEWSFVRRCLLLGCCCDSLLLSGIESFERVLAWRSDESFLIPRSFPGVDCQRTGEKKKTEFLDLINKEILRFEWNRSCLVDLHCVFFKRSFFISCVYISEPPVASEFGNRPEAAQGFSNRRGAKSWYSMLESYICNL